MKTARRYSWLACLLLLAGCQLFHHTSGGGNEHPDKEPAPELPSKYTFRVSQFVFLSDVELRQDQPLAKDLAQHRETIYRELRLPASNTDIFVCLFQDQWHFEKFMKAKYPYLPNRRAFFVAQPRRLGGTEDLMVYTYWGERVQQDLRHELTHAILHSVLKDVPIWLDEGLAEYFEVPAGTNGVNPKHVELLRQTDVRFDLDRLEQLKEINQMTPAEYREAWAWTHLMLRSTPRAKQALLSYLQELRTNANPGTLRPRLAPAFLSLDGAVQTHLADLERKLPKTATARQ
jgi:hypothetical protein